MNETLEKTIIKKTPDVCGGDACIGNRRIPVWLIVEYRRLGRSDDGIRNMFELPLTHEEFDAAIDYFDNNRDEIERAIQANDSDDDDGE